MDPMKKVQTGDKLRIPAAAYNAFIDAAHDLQDRQRNQGRTPQAAYRTSGIVLVKNASGADQDRFAVLGVDAPIYTPEDNLDSFKNKVALAGVVPTVRDHYGRFVVLLEPLKAGAIGMAYAAGVCPVKVDVPEDGQDLRFADVADDTTGHLLTGRSGAASILWKEEGVGSVWALVRLANPDGQPAGALFAVMVQQMGGSAGDDQTRCSFTYGVSDLFGRTLAENAAPWWNRPKGMMEPAWHGMGYYDPDGNFVLHQVDEAPVTWTCQEAP